MEKKQSIKKILKGKVLSDKMNKTRIVLVERKTRHPLYEKVIRRFKKYAIHDEKNQSKEGDFVEFVECRPLSKTKHFRLVKVIRTDEGAK